LAIFMNYLPGLKIFYVEFEEYVLSNCLKPNNQFNNKIVYK